MRGRRAEQGRTRQLSWRQQVQARLAAERGTCFKQAPCRVALLKPSSYFASMSSLGLQRVYGLFNAEDGVAAERAFLPDTVGDGPLRTYESGMAVGAADLVALSVGYELEMGDLLVCLQRAGLAFLAKDRGVGDPLVLLGGPLTFSNPRPLAPLVDLMVLGEADEVIGPLARIVARGGGRERILDEAASLPGVWVPSRQEEAPLPLQLARPESLACSTLLTPHTELSDMFLVEVSRGCHRRCDFCVMRRGAGAGMRLFSAEQVWEHIPDWADRVGLVGAAVADHPHLVGIIERLVGQGRQCSLSSLRSDRISAPLLDALVAGGLKTLTIAADGASEALRRRIHKDVDQGHLVAAVEAARARRLKVKLYVMVGLPGESEGDIDELVHFIRTHLSGLSATLGVAPFISKRNTPLDGLPFAGIKEVERRMARLRHGVGGIAEVRAASARWAWIEHALAQGDERLAAVAIAAYHDGGTFAAWKRALTSAGLGG